MLFLPSATRNLFANGLQKLAKKTSFCFNPDDLTDSEAPSLMGWGCQPPFTNGLKKLVKKTIFSSVPGELREASAHKSVRREMARSAFLGWGCQPPFENNVSLTRSRGGKGENGAIYLSRIASLTNLPIYQYHQYQVDNRDFLI